MKIVIIKYNAGNVCSVQFGLQRLGVNAIVTDDAEEILTADKTFFPFLIQSEKTSLLLM